MIKKLLIAFTAAVLVFGSLSVVDVAAESNDELVDFFDQEKIEIEHHIDKPSIPEYNLLFDGIGYEALEDIDVSIEGLTATEALGNIGIEQIRRELNDIILKLPDASKRTSKFFMKDKYDTSSFKTFDDSMVFISSESKTHYESLKQILNSKKSDEYKIVSIASLFAYNSDFVSYTNSAAKYLDGSQNPVNPTDSIIIKAFNNACTISILGAEAGAQSTGFGDRAGITLAESFKLINIVLEAKNYVYNHITDLQSASTSDVDLSTLLDSEYDHLTQSSYKSEISDLHKSFEHYFTYADENTVSNVYNKYIEDKWFTYIKSAEFKTEDNVVLDFLPIIIKTEYASDLITEYSRYGYGGGMIDACVKRINNQTNNALNDTQLINLFNHFRTVENPDVFSTALDVDYVDFDDGRIGSILQSYGFDVSKLTAFAHSAYKDYKTYEVSRDNYEQHNFLMVQYGGHNGANYKKFELQEGKTINFNLAVDGNTKRTFYNTSGYNGSIDSRVLNEYDSADKAYHNIGYICPADIFIDTPEDFVNFIKNVASGQSYLGKTIVLNNDIDLSDYNYADLWKNSNSNNCFRGTLDGNGYTIKGIKYNSDSSCAGLFRSLGDMAIVENLYLQNISISCSGSNGICGAVAGKTFGEVIVRAVNVKSGTITGGYCVGGIIGRMDSDSLHINSCVNYASVSATNGNAGGILGESYYKPQLLWNENGGTVTGNIVGGILGWNEDEDVNFANNINNGEIIGSSDAGGILGYGGNCSDDPEYYFYGTNINNGDVTGGGNVGGIIGCLRTDDSNIIRGCENHGDIETTGSNTYAGGIVGKSNGGGDFTNNRNTGNITGKAEAGGILGWNEDDYINFSGCVNKGNVYNKSHAGGIAGYVGNCNKDRSYDFSRCFNYGHIHGQGHCGGILGYLDTDNKDCNFYSSYNFGNVKCEATGELYVGGIVGKSNGGGNFTYCQNYGFIEGPGAAGGIMGWNEDDYINFDGCYNGCDVKSLNSHAGGVIGVCYSGCSLKSCENHGTITGVCAGGLIGWNEDDKIEFSYSKNTGSINGTSDTGGIAGYVGNCTHDREYIGISCKNLGNVYSTGHAGGIIGNLRTDSTNNNFSNSENSGYIRSENGNAGGIIGNSFGGGNFTNCKNTYYIYAGGCAGGIVGWNEDDGMDFSNSSNDGRIMSTNGDAGGIAGYVGSKSEDDEYFGNNCVNNGEVISNANAGGIIGNLYSDADHSFCNCKNYGDIRSVSKYVGAVVGACYGGGNFKNNTNYGILTGKISENKIMGYREDDKCRFDGCVYQASRNTGSILSEGALWIVIGVLVLGAGTCVTIVLVKKKKQKRAKENSAN